MIGSFFRVVLIVLVCMWPNLVHAQEQSTPEPQAPLMGSEATAETPNQPVNGIADAEVATGVTRVLVIGDALAGGLGAGMTRMAQEQNGFEIINRFNESSGLARTEVYDWAGALSKIVAAKPVDAVVVLVGVNDRQGIKDGNIRYVFRAPEWAKGYTSNVDRLIEAVNAAKAKLYWISIPPMADSAFDADMRYLSDIHRERVAAKGGQYIDVRPFFVAADGSYVDRGPDETGVERKLRSRDGITFFKQGNNRFGQLVLGAIKSLDKNAIPAVVSTPPANAIEPKVAAQSPVVTEPPSFGQDGLDGESLVFRADSLKAASAAAAPTKSTVTQSISGQGANSALGTKLSAKAGSQSEKLLTGGIVAAAPAGRFDDYSVPPLQQ